MISKKGWRETAAREVVFLPLPLGEVLLVITLVRNLLCILFSVLVAVTTAYNHNGRLCTSYVWKVTIAQITSMERSCPARQVASESSWCPHCAAGDHQPGTGVTFTPYAAVLTGYLHGPFVMLATGSYSWLLSSPLAACKHGLPDICPWTLK